MKPASKRTAQPFAKRSPKLRAVIVGLYCFFMGGQVALITIEIARLSVAEKGVGLLPFVYAVILAKIIIQLTWQVWTVVAASIAFWMVYAVMNVVKLATLVNEEFIHHLRDRNDQYKLIDQITDLGAIIGLSVVLSVLELVLSNWKVERREVKTERGSMDPRIHR